MYLPEPSKGGEYEVTPAGTHLAVCYRFIDLGTQENTYLGNTKKQRKVMLSWELPDCLMEQGDNAGRPFTFHNRYTWSMHEKATLRSHLEAWRGKPFQAEDFGQGGFDIRNILGKGCLLNIVHTVKGEKTYEDLSSVAALMRGMETPDTINERLFLSLEPNLFDQSVFDLMSDSVRATIAKSPEYQSLTVSPQASSASVVYDERAGGFGGEKLPDSAYADAIRM